MNRTFAAAVFALLTVTAPGAASLAATDNLPTTVPIPNEWRTCHQDSDCTLIKACGQCCPWSSINTQWVEAYKKLSEKDCKNPDNRLCPCAYQTSYCNHGVCFRH